MSTNWKTVALDAHQKEHAKQTASLQQQLDHALAQIERLEKSKRAKVIAASPTRRREDGDTITVCVPDTHGAKIARAEFAAMLADIKALNPQRVILLGDHVDCGGFLAQHHVMGYVAETSYSYEDDIAEANGFLDSLRSAAPSAKIEYIEGNHERRVETWCVTQTLRHKHDSEGLRKLYAPEYRLNLKERGIAYYRDSVCYDGLSLPGVIKRGKCYFFHGFSTSKNATASTVEKIAGNCVFGHTHRAGQSAFTEASGGKLGRILRGFEGGHLMDIRKAAYTKGTMNWQQAFLILEEDAKGVQVSIIHIEKDGTFAVNGRRYGRSR